MSSRFLCVTSGMKGFFLDLLRAAKRYSMCFESGVYGLA